MKTTTNPTSMSFHRITSFALLLGAIVLAGITNAANAKDPSAKVVPPGTTFRGHTYGEWGAIWWQTAFSIPVEDGSHPILSGGAFEGPDGLVFLAGVGGGVTIDITIPAGTPILFPVINTECSVLEPDPFHGDDEASLRACANGHIDNTSGKFAVIDGVPLTQIESYRVESPLFQFGPLPEDNLFEFIGLDAPAGTTSPSVDAGIYVLLEPLNVGRHTIHFGGTFDEFSFSIDTTYNVNVVPKKQSRN